jgi:hypothetical protein
MNLLYPKIRWACLPAMLGYAAAGAMLAGIYGIAHDQFTYSISPEYFTRLKFEQFHYANFGLPERVFVAEIGFLATWWVGFFSAWFLARLSVPAFPPRLARRYIMRGFLVVLAGGLAGLAVGYLLGIQWMPPPPDSDWHCVGAALGIVDLQSFVRVAYLHNCGYLGGLIGVVAALIYVARRRNDQRRDPNTKE